LDLVFGQVDKGSWRQPEDLKSSILCGFESHLAYQFMETKKERFKIFMHVPDYPCEEGSVTIAEVDAYVKRCNDFITERNKMFRSQIEAMFGDSIII
jgi:hypothetical protein